ARAAARIGRAVRLGVSAQGGARPGTRSAPPGDRAARRARRAGDGRAGRGSGLEHGERRQGLADGRAECGARARRLLRLPSDDTIQRVAELYRHTDPALARALEERMGLAAIARAGGMENRPAKPPAGGAAQVLAFFAESAGAAAKFLARPDGPRIGALAYDGW